MKIIAGLEAGPNPQLFEQCAVALLKAEGFSAGWIPGGQDGGKDAVIWDEQAEPYPVVITTRRANIERNVKDNLTTYRCKEGARRKYIVATCRSLNDNAREKIIEKASALEFTHLVRIFDQTDFADFLRHRSPYWRKALLNILESTSALSLSPVETRATSTGHLVGREASLTWLHSTEGDRLVVGEPGAGKTALLKMLAQDKSVKAFFVVEQNYDKVVDAVLEIDPDILIFDDAHENTQFLRQLLRLRNECAKPFTIIATCWPAQILSVRQILRTELSREHSLPRLSTGVIEHILRKHGLGHSYLMVRKIERQSEGLPGRALTLADLALRTRETDLIRSAQALFDDIIGFFDRLDDPNMKYVLACCALGGDVGMSRKAVQAFLQISRTELATSITNLSGTGTISDVPERRDYIAVRPAELRPALIREILFSQISPFEIVDISEFVECSASRVQTARELIKAKELGADIPDRLLETYIEPLPKDNGIWIEFAFSQEIHAKDAVTKTMSDAIGEDFEPKLNWERELDNLLRWLKSEYESADQALARRAICLQCAKEWICDRNDRAVGYKVLLFAMDPRIEAFVHKDKQSGTWISGWMPKLALQRMQHMWNDIMSCVQDVEPPEWDSFLDIVEAWAYPLDCPDEYIYEELTTFGRQMALDVARAAAGNVALLHRLKAITERAHPDLEIISDPVVTALYPIGNLTDDRDDQQHRWQKSVAHLAASWSDKEPTEVIEILERFEIGLLGVRGLPYRYTPNLCRLLAQNSNAPLEWLESFLVSNLPSDTVIPFLHVAIDGSVEGWEQALQACMDMERTKEDAIRIALIYDNIPESIRRAAIRDSALYPDMVAHLIWSNRVSRTTTLDLYAHEDEVLVGKVAIAQWRQADTHEIPSWVRPAWEKAIIENASEDYWLDSILLNEVDLGKRWISHRVRDASFEPFRFEQTISVVVASLSVEERMSLLKIIPNEYKMHSVVEAIVGDNVKVFERLLNLPLDDYIKLSPLGRGSVDSVWIDFASIAYDYGYKPQSIAPLAFTGVIFTGEYVDRLKYQYEQFDTFRNHENPSVREIASAGYEINYHHYQELLKREQEEASDE